MGQQVDVVQSVALDGRHHRHATADDGGQVADQLRPSARKLADLMGAGPRWPALRTLISRRPTAPSCTRPTPSSASTARSSAAPGGGIFPNEAAITRLIGAMHGWRDTEQLFQGGLHHPPEGSRPCGTPPNGDGMALPVPCPGKRSWRVWPGDGRSMPRPAGRVDFSREAGSQV